MEKIKYYKLVSPYPEDETMNCKLTMSDMDHNFLTFKDYDIKDASFDKDSTSINIERNNGEKINIDLSDINDLIEEKVEDALSGYTPGGYDVSINGELDNNGVLTITLTTASGETSTKISGFITEAQIDKIISSKTNFTDDTINGNGSKTNPLRLSNLEKTGKYKSVDGIVDSLPELNVGEDIGKRFILGDKFHKFGRLYDAEGVEMVKKRLADNGYLWRVPKQEDWFKLFQYAEMCADSETTYNIYNIEIGEYIGDLVGSVLKSINYWDGNTNYDTLNFSALPSGFSQNGSLVGARTDARFWSDTLVMGQTESKYIEGFNCFHDNVLIDSSKNGEYYSIRLVLDIDENGVDDKINILGNTYDVVNLKEINQAWITVNLNYNPSDEHTEQFGYDFVDITFDRFKLNHWNGYTWETKELNNGDEINVQGFNLIMNYVCIEDESGNQILVKGETYKRVNDKWRMVIDCGWY